VVKVRPDLGLWLLLTRLACLREVYVAAWLSPGGLRGVTQAAWMLAVSLLSLSPSYLLSTLSGTPGSGQLAPPTRQGPERFPCCHPTLL
jgi:hypothetical protein